MPYTNVNQIYRDYANEIEQYDLYVVDHVVERRTFADTYKEYVVVGEFWDWDPEYSVKVWFRYRRSNDAWYIMMSGYSKDDHRSVFSLDRVTDDFTLDGRILWFDDLMDAINGAYDYYQEAMPDSENIRW